MSCKSWWRRGDGELTGTSRRDFLFGGRGNDRVEGYDGNDFIWTGRGDDYAYGGEGNDRIWGWRGDDHLYGGDGDDRIRGGRGNDTLDGGAGRDRIHAGSGDDHVIHTLAENVGSKDYYNGGRGTDTIYFRMSHADYTPEMQAEFEAFEEFLAQPGSRWKYQSFEFKTLDLKVKNFEHYEIEYTDAASSPDTPSSPDPASSVPANAAPVAENDMVVVDLTNDPIQEIEPNDPSGIPLSTASAQAIARSSFRIAPSSDVDNDALPRVSIHGTISPSFSFFGPAANDVDLYAITLLAGEKLILDIDYAFLPDSSMNAQLFLMDSSGSVLAENDNSSMDSGGGGSTSPFDSYLEYTDPGSGGTYYVAVSAWDNDPDGSGFFNDGGIMAGDYVLNVSIDNASADIGAFVISPDTLLANDSDADGDALVVTSVSNAVNGTVELTSAGEILFRPTSLSPGAFDYVISDGNGGDATAKAIINGNPVLGTASDDVLVSTNENDFMVGGGGNDTYNFATGAGRDTITDFVLGSDRLAITDGMMVADIEAKENGTLVSFDTGDSVLLVGVSGVTDETELFG